MASSDFTWDEYSWMIRLPLDEWSSPGQYGSVPVVFAPEGRDERPMHPSELALVQWLSDHHARASASVVRALAETYASVYASLLDEAPELAAELPDSIGTPDALRALIRLTSVNVHQIELGEAPFLGFVFDAAWDEEHGAGVLTHGDRVLEVGGADTACLLWLAKRHAHEQSRSH